MALGDAFIIMLAIQGTQLPHIVLITIYMYVLIFELHTGEHSQQGAEPRVEGGARTRELCLTS